MSTITTFARVLVYLQIASHMTLTVLARPDIQRRDNRHVEIPFGTAGGHRLACWYTSEPLPTEAINTFAGEWDDTRTVIERLVEQRYSRPVPRRHQKLHRHWNIDFYNVAGDAFRYPLLLEALSALETEYMRQYVRAGEMRNIDCAILNDDVGMLGGVWNQWVPGDARLPAADDGNQRPALSLSGAATPGNVD